MLEVISHGHACVEISSTHGTLLIDPFITGNPVCDITFDDLAKKPLTHICITHGHGDHVIELVRMFPEVQVVTVYGLEKYLRTQGVVNVQGFGIGGTYTTTHFSIKFYTAVHEGEILDTTISSTPAGVLVTIGGKKIYHAGDTALTNEFTLLQPIGIDLALVPIGGIYTMDVEDAITAVAMIRPKIAVPIHYDTGPKIQSDDQTFARGVMMHGSVPKVLKPGQAVVRENE